MRKVLFIDRDGTLIEDDAGKSPTSPGGVRLARGVIPALLRFRAAGYELVIVTNQGGLGTPSYPREPFERVDAFVHGLLASQGVEFAANFICPHPAEAGCACRKPAIGLVRDYVNAAPLDRERSADRRRPRHRRRVRAQPRRSGLQDRQRRAPRPGPRSRTRCSIGRASRKSRGARARRTSACASISTARPSRARRPASASSTTCSSSSASTAASRSTCSARATCTSTSTTPSRTSRSRSARRCARRSATSAASSATGSCCRWTRRTPRCRSTSAGGRSSCSRAQFPRDRVGELPTELVPHFFRSLAETLGAAIHVRVRGENAHHMVEVCFKGVARALRQAIARRGDELPIDEGHAVMRDVVDHRLVRVEPRVARLRARAARRRRARDRRSASACGARPT